LRAQRERYAQRQCRQRIAEVVDQICQQRDAAARHEHRGLRERRQRQDRQRERYRLDALPRTLEALVHEAMRMTVPVPVMAMSSARRRRRVGRLREPDRGQMPVGTPMRMGMDPPTMPVRQRIDLNRPSHAKESRGLAETAALTSPAPRDTSVRQAYARLAQKYGVTSISLLARRPEQ
jgi:hypothetical protein